MADSGEDRGMKRQYDDDEGSSSNLIKKRRGEGPKYDLRILLQSKNAGAIIGKKGDNIKRLRSTYNATVQVPDCKGPERVLLISSNVGTVLNALLDIIPTLEDYQGNKDLDFEAEIRILVHQSQAGAIIGRAGYKIKELREKTGTKIKVYSSCCPRSTERIISITGKPVDVVNCIGTIVELLHDQAPPKGPSQPYDPLNYDEFYAYDYGGYTTEDNFGPTGSGGWNRGNRNNRSGSGGRSGGGGGGRYHYDDDDGFPSRSEQRSGGGSYGGRSGGGGGGGRPMGGFQSRNNTRNGFGGGGSRNMGNDSGFGFGGDNDSFSRGGNFRGGNMGGGNMGGMGSPGFGSGGGSHGNHQRVSIPKQLAGAIIGKGGKRIQSIRMRSGAEIKIDEAGPGSNERIITLNGTSEQIQNAQFLLQQSVKQHAGDKY